MRSRLGSVCERIIWGVQKAMKSIEGGFTLLIVAKKASGCFYSTRSGEEGRGGGFTPPVLAVRASGWFSSISFPFQDTKYN